MAQSLREEAREGVIFLEAQCGERLDEVAVAMRDQWTAGVRTMFRDLGVDLSRPEEANAAFAGARLGVATLMTQSANSGKATAHLLRYLLDKSEGYNDTTRRRKFRVWLGSKVLPE